MVAYRCITVDVLSSFTSILIGLMIGWLSVDTLEIDEGSLMVDRWWIFVSLMGNDGG